MLQVKLKRTVDDSYPIRVERGILERVPSILKAGYPASRYVVVCDRTTEKLFGRELERRLRKAGQRTLLLSVPAGERSKTQRQKTRLEEAMLRAWCDRRSVVIAIGSGVVDDLAGFVAVTYLRGIRYVQVPTTLLSMVDSAIGGKTGIDTPAGKNLIGALHQPKAVFADPGIFARLSWEQRAEGLTEAAKMFMTHDAQSFFFLKGNLKNALDRKIAVLMSAIKRAAAIKARVVSGGEREGSARMVLNFRHTIGHAIEKLSRYCISHEEAVALNIAVEARIARRRNILTAKDFAEIVSFIVGLGTSVRILKKFSSRAIIRATHSDKKSVSGSVRYVLLKRIGAVYRGKREYVHKVSNAEALKVTREIQLSK